MSLFELFLEKKREERFRGEREMGKEETDRSGADEKVPFYKLFSFADGLDILLMSVGTVAAIVSGLSLPLMTLIFGQIINSFGDANSSDVVHVISKVCMFVSRGMG